MALLELSELTKRQLTVSEARLRLVRLRILRGQMIVRRTLEIERRNCSETLDLCHYLVDPAGKDAAFVVEMNSLAGVLLALAAARTFALAVSITANRDRHSSEALEDKIPGLRNNGTSEHNVKMWNLGGRAILSSLVRFCFEFRISNT